ncbi:MAG: RidA family protein [Candidatus Roizmanbacteria bacterium]
MKIVQASDAPVAVGPYSVAIEANDFIFTAGQIGLDPKTNLVVEGLEAQTKQLLSNLKSVLESGGSDLEHVVKTTVFLKNMGDFAKMNDIYATYFSDHKPARSTVGVADLPKGALIEIEVIAIRKM